MHCPICESHTLATLYKLYDDRYGYKGVFDLYKCNECGHLSLNITFEDEELKDLYTNYYPRSKLNIGDWNPPGEISSFKKWWNGLNASAYRWVPKNIRVLDIGCGFGQSLGYHRERGCEAYGVEADSNAKRVADAYHLNINIGLFDPKNYNKNSFDYVTLDQVIEHAGDPIELLNGIKEILKPNGIVVISTPNANGWGAKFFGKKWIHWHTPYHLQFFSGKSMQLSAKKSGFSVEKVKTVSNSEWLYYQLMHLVTYPKEGQKSVFWSSGKIEGKKIRMLVFVAKVLHKLKINNLVTRLFDIFGVGDNQIYILRKI